MTDKTSGASNGTLTEEANDAAARVDGDAPPEKGAPDPHDVRAGATPLREQHARRDLTLSVRGLVLGVIIALLVASAGTLAWLYHGAEQTLDTQATASSNNAHAEKIALDYAVAAATMDYKDLQSWKVKLVAGTSKELNDKLTNAAASMEQILVPLQWASSAEPLVAKVRSITGSIYVVDCFVSVQTKTVQAPEALQSTATYSVTIDSNQQWQITDVGGIGSVVGPGK